MSKNKKKITFDSIEWLHGKFSRKVKKNNTNMTAVLNELMRGYVKGRL